MWYVSSHIVVEQFLSFLSTRKESIFHISDKFLRDFDARGETMDSTVISCIIYTCKLNHDFVKVHGYGENCGLCSMASSMRRLI